MCIRDSPSCSVSTPRGGLYSGGSIAAGLHGAQVTWVTLTPRSITTNDSRAMETVFSGIQPTGGFHIGNLLGAVQNWVALMNDPNHRCWFCIVDLHALTQDYEPRDMPARVSEMAAELLASGIDPDRCTLFVQSHVPEHSELAWMLNCV